MILEFVYNTNGTLDRLGTKVSAQNPWSTCWLGYPNSFKFTEYLCNFPGISEIPKCCFFVDNVQFLT